MKYLFSWCTYFRRCLRNANYAKIYSMRKFLRTQYLFLLGMGKGVYIYIERVVGALIEIEPRMGTFQASACKQGH